MLKHCSFFSFTNAFQFSSQESHLNSKRSCMQHVSKDSRFSFVNWPLNSTRGLFVARGFKLRLATGSEGYLLTGLYDIVLNRESLLPKEEALNSAWIRCEPVSKGRGRRKRGKYSYKRAAIRAISISPRYFSKPCTPRRSKYLRYRVHYAVSSRDHEGKE